MIGFHSKSINNATEYIRKKYQFKLNSQEMVDAFEREFNCIVYSGFLEFPQDEYETAFLLRFS
ncbi:MAG: hypothetical protein RLY43_392 [Bacteroidota bacterium]|jgi:hypothetical protein